MNLTSQHGQSILIGQVESRKLTILFRRRKEKRMSRLEQRKQKGDREKERVGMGERD